MNRSRCFVFMMLLFPLVLSFMSNVSGNPGQTPVPADDYPDQMLPGDKAQIFAPGIVCTGLNERDTAISPDGKELYFSILMSNQGFIIFMKQEQGKWSPPAVASFSGKYSDLEPALAPDGKKLFFVSNRPLTGQGDPKEDYDIWFVERKGAGWGEPQNPGPPLNSPRNEFYPSITRKGTVYFCSRVPGSTGGEDIYKSQWLDGTYGEPVNLGEAVNTKAEEFNAFVAPDESYIIYTTTGRGPGLGGGDLWINFRQDDGTWSEPINMGEKVNSPALEYCPYVSPDGKFLFFTSQRRILSQEAAVPITYEMIKKMSTTYGNGNGDIYWLSSKIIDELARRR